MLARFGHLVLIVALLGATGTHWAVLQSVAWATMLADNARTEPLQTALAETFDGQHPCSLCKQIAKGTQSEHKSDVRAEVKQLEFVNSAAIFSFVAPLEFRLLPELQFAGGLLPITPPIPPPRNAAA